jgi:Phage protein (N4 Gp49/phage Sf6 gene 66) family
MNDQEIEKEIQAKGLIAPRVTLQQIEDSIQGETYTVLPSGRATICEMTLKNGYVVLGESLCVSRENFNAELGQKIAREDAKQKIWPLEGYLLRQQLSMK